MLTRHELWIRVRYQETDAMGYLHHANYLTYFEMGRTELLRANGFTYQQMEEAGLLMVVVRMNVRYRKPAKYDDLLCLRTELTKASAAKVEHAYQVLRQDEVLAEADSVLACVDRQGAIQRVPPWLWQ